MRIMLITKEKIASIYFCLIIINYTIEGFLKSFPIQIGNHSILWMASSILQWICFFLLAYAYINAFSKYGIATLGILFLMLLCTYFFYEQNFLVYSSLMTDIVQGGCILLITSNQNTINYMEAALLKAAIITFIVLCMYPILNTKQFFLTTNYMVFSNGMIVSVIVFLNKFFKGNHFYFIPAFIGLMEIVFCGSRSPLLSFIIFVILYFGLVEQRSRKKVLICLNTLFAAALFFFIISNKELLKILYQWVLETTGRYSRTLYEMVYGESVFALHGREDIYLLFAKNISHILLKGYGLAGDRVFLEDTVHLYSHNIFLEIWIEFGIIAGSCFLYILFALLLHPMKKRNLSKDHLVYIVLFSVIIGKLLLSSSWIQEPLFYLLVGLALSIRNKSRLRTHSRKGDQVYSSY